MSASESEPTSSRLPLTVALVTVCVLAVTWAWHALAPSLAATLSFAIAQVVMISIVIWQACDPFADAAQWLGERYRIPGSVRGATLDAIASSMPELFSGIFFVVVAIAATDGSAAAVSAAGSEGFGATVATCAGSAVYNMMLIPAICALVISVSRKSHPTIDVESKVITRDGMWFLGCELVLIMFLYQAELQWWMALVLIGMYCGYVAQLVLDAKSFQRARDVVQNRLADHSSTDTDSIVRVLREEGIRPSLSLIEQVRRERNSESAEDAEEEEEDAAGALFGLVQIPLTLPKAWIVIGFSTLVAAAACYWLVEVTREAAATLNVPIFFLAVIVAAAASSVPDTFLSVGAARRGDDDGAVSNAFGSNIFDICICLAVPLLVNSYLNGWQPVLMTENGQPIAGLVGLRVLLCGLTLVTLLIMWHGHQLTRRKAFVLIGLYGIFVAYAIAGSLGFSI